jgi:type II secretory pathway pseudopilin PulG
VTVRTLEAESALMNGGSRILDFTGSSNGKVVGYTNNANDGMTFFNVPAGRLTEIGYRTGGHTGFQTININGSVSSILYPTSNAVAKLTVDYSVPDNAAIVIRGTTKGPWVDIDYIKVTTGSNNPIPDNKPIITTSAGIQASGYPSSGSAYSGETVYITGSHFGTTKGTVKIGSTIVTVTSWSDNNIVVTMPTVSSAITAVWSITTANGNIESASNFTLNPPLPVYDYYY